MHVNGFTTIFINANRKCTRKDLWDGDICDYAAI